MLILELFSGTGSLGKVARKRGHTVISVDIDEKMKPDIVCDILKLNYKQLPVPDFIWASPPCDTFSPLVCSHRQPARDCKTYKAITEKGKLGDKYLKKTMEIIRYFESINPCLKFVIENPRGMMRKQPIMKHVERATTTYCKYGSKKKKATDFFNNFNLMLLPVCTPKNRHRGKFEHIPVQQCSLLEKYKIPPRLIETILIQAGG